MRNWDSSGVSKGFTLIELLITLVIGLVLIGGVALIFIASQQAITQAQTVARLQENLRFSSDFLVRDVRNAGFRDEASLFWSQYDFLGRNRATIESNEPFGDRLTVRYAGLGTCDQDFGTVPAIVANAYDVGVVDGERVLRCNGVRLVSGINELRADGLCSDGTLNCDCPDDCVGVLLTLELDGGGQGNSDVSVEMKALFRNRILESLFP